MIESLRLRLLSTKSTLPRLILISYVNKEQEQNQHSHNLSLGLVLLIDSL